MNVSGAHIDGPGKRRAVVTAVVTCVLGAVALTPSAAAELRVREDVANLSSGEKAAFVHAARKLKRTPSPYDPELSWYDQFVEWHLYLSRCNPTDLLADRIMVGHAGPIFLPWHRQYLFLLERAMRKVTGKRVAVPYWDWTNPKSTRAVFSADFMGGDGDPAEGYAVTTGPFRKDKWRLNVHNEGLVYGPSATTSITRRFASFGGPDLPTDEDVADAMDAPVYDVPPFDDSSDPAESFRNALEGYAKRPTSVMGCTPDGWLGTLPLGDASLHNKAHLWVGGMLPPSESGALRFGTLTANLASPNDPVFFLLHSNVDRLWADWQKVNGIDTYRPVSGYEHNSVDDVMHPLEEAGGAPTPADVASIRKLGYRYARPAAERRAASAAPRAARDGANSKLPATAVPPGMPAVCTLGSGPAPAS